MMTDRRPGYIEDYMTPRDWADLAELAQDRADYRRAIERDRERRLLPPGLLAKLGVLTVALAVALFVWLLLVLVGAATYDPAFSSR